MEPPDTEALTGVAAFTTIEVTLGVMMEDSVGSGDEEATITTTIEATIEEAAAAGGATTLVTI